MFCCNLVYTLYSNVSYYILHLLIIEHQFFVIKLTLLYKHINKHSLSYDKIEFFLFVQYFSQLFEWIEIVLRKMNKNIPCSVCKQLSNRKGFQ